MKHTRVVLICLMLIAKASVAAEPMGAAEMSDRLRQELEVQFIDSTGLGFASFECDLPGDGSRPREFTCQAVDVEGDRFFYRIVFHDNGEAPLITTSQPVSQLNAAGLAALERPCLAFLNAFQREEWNEAYLELSKQFQADVSLSELEFVLAPLHQAIGKVEAINAELYTTPSPGLHGLEYALKTAGGEAVARFQLRFDDDENARIVAFLVTAEPGTALQAALLSASGIQTLSGLLGQAVVRIDAPLANLERLGDSVEGKVWLIDGSELAIRVAQFGSAHDLDGNDYRFQVLDVPWLINRYLVSTGATPSQINCPSRVAPDGGRIECMVTFEDGSERSIALARREGEYRLVE